MTTRIVSRVTILLVALAAATALMIGALSLLASTSPADAATFLERDQVAAVQRTIEAPASEETSDATPTPAIVLVFAGIVLMAALPPIHRVHVYHRSSYYRSDWL
jgi:hypothetical protein